MAKSAAYTRFALSTAIVKMLKVRKHIVAVLLALILCDVVVAQQAGVFIRNVNKASSDSERVVALGQLANYYFLNNQENSGDSTIEKQMMEAEASGNQNLVIISLFENPRYNFSDFTSRNVSAKSLQYIERAVDYAKSNGLAEKLSLGYCRLANYYHLQGNKEQALRNATLGFTTAQGTHNDSVKVMCALQLGDVYEAKSEALLAFKTYTIALDIANAQKNDLLLPPVYHKISDLYRKRLNQPDIAKAYLFKSVEVNKQFKNEAGLMEDYLSLAKLYDYDISIDYAEKAEKVAYQLQDEVNAIRAQKIIFTSNMSKEPSVALKYLYSHPLLMKSYRSAGEGYLQWMIGEVFLMSNKYDSALNYFSLAEPYFNNNFDLNTRKGFYNEMATCYDRLQKAPLAIAYYQKTIDIAKTTGDLERIASCAKHLKTLYEKQGRFKEALAYSNEYELYEDSLVQLKKEKDLVFVEIDNENKRRAKEAELAEIKEARRHNLQYMGITVVVATAFVSLITLGMFRVSKFTIKILGFFSFIFLFEFILMLLEKVIHHYTHGEPWKVWLIKIAIISFMFPLHHYLEEKLIHYLISRRLIDIRQRFSPGRFIKRLGKKKKVQKMGEDEMLISPSHEPV